jgi:hypothetical protein
MSTGSGVYSIILAAEKKTLDQPLAIDSNRAFSSQSASLVIFAGNVVSVWHNERSVRHTVDILMRKIGAAYGWLYLLVDFIVVALHRHWSASITYASA